MVKRDTCCLPAGKRSKPGVDLSQSFSGVVTIETVPLAAARYLMGTSDGDAIPEDHETPPKEVSVDSFEIATTTVTNVQFQRFVADTGYETTAEKQGSSFVFRSLLNPSRRRRQQRPESIQSAPWWLLVNGACWRRPEGRGSDLQDRWDHPVVHVSWYDAIAYSNWCDARLPSEAEWEYAARGGLVQCRYPWGNELTPDGQHRCNIWQGCFPDVNTCEDGYFGTAPAKTFEPNGYGLFNMAGNVWEWCDDWFGSASPSPQFRTGKVLKGGSFLCHVSYCNRYRVSARYANAPTSSTSNCGFRVVRTL